MEELETGERQDWRGMTREKKRDDRGGWQIGEKGMKEESVRARRKWIRRGEE